MDKNLEWILAELDRMEDEQIQAGKLDEETINAITYANL